jgi:hypothetical protein
MSNMNRVQLMLKRQGRLRPQREPFEGHRTPPIPIGALSNGEPGRGSRSLSAGGTHFSHNRPDIDGCARRQASTVMSSTALARLDPDEREPVRLGPLQPLAVHEDERSLR